MKGGVWRAPGPATGTGQGVRPPGPDVDTGQGGCVTDNHAMDSGSVGNVGGRVWRATRQATDTGQGGSVPNSPAMGSGGLENERGFPALQTAEKNVVDLKIVTKDTSYVYDSKKIISKEDIPKEENLRK